MRETQDALDAVQQLDPDERKEVVKAVVERLEPGKANEAIAESVKAMPSDQRQEALKSAGRLPPATPAVWYVVMGILAVVIVGGGWMAAALDGSDEAALYGFVGLALGAVVGLLAPGPTAKG